MMRRADLALRHEFADVNGVRLHCACVGEGPLILFLHGFPEFWYMWRDQLAEFGRTHHAVAVDMRGYNLSSKPEEVEAYRIRHLVEDVRALADHFGAERFVLVAHDWGGAIAWAFAMAHPDRLEKLVIINGPHPVVFARELRDSPQQQAASQYMQMFRSPDAERILSANEYAWLLHAALSTGLRAGTLNEQDRLAYIEAWSQPGALTGGLNYYRANVGSARAGDPGASLQAVPRARPKLEVPTLVIWGERDRALLTGNLVGLEEHVDSLTIRRIPDGTHWVVHEQPHIIRQHIREFLAEPS